MERSARVNIHRRVQVARESIERYRARLPGRTALLVQPCGCAEADTLEFDGTLSSNTSHAAGCRAVDQFEFPADRPCLDSVLMGVPDAHARYVENERAFSSQVPSVAVNRKCHRGLGLASPFRVEDAPQSDMNEVSTVRGMFIWPD